MGGRYIQCIDVAVVNGQWLRSVVFDTICLKVVLPGKPLSCRFKVTIVLRELIDFLIDFNIAK